MNWVSAAAHQWPSTLNPDGAPADEREERVRLRAHPDFPAIARRVIGELERAYRDHFLLTRLLNDRARILLALLMLEMHFDPADAPGLTAGRLKDEACALGLCSRGRVGAVLALCRLKGLVMPAPDSDRRRRRLAVTERMLEIHRQRWRILLRALAELAPEGALGLARLEDRAFLAEFVPALLAPLRRGWRVIHDVPALGPFPERDGGLMIAFALFEAAHLGQPVSAAQLSRNYGLSRSHVADILAKAAEEGLVIRFEPGEPGTPPGSRAGGHAATPALIDAIEAFVAVALARNIRAVRSAVTRER